MASQVGQCEFWAGEVGGFNNLFTNWIGIGPAPFPDTRPGLTPRGPITFEGAKLPVHTDAAGNQVPTPLFLTANGGNGRISVNLGLGQFSGTVPTGYFPGWPNAALSAIDQFDASTIVGDVQLLPATNEVNFTGPGPGYIQSATGWSYGKYYVEFTVTATTVFTTGMGIGAARFAPGLSEWSNGAFSASDANGGAGVKGNKIKWNNLISAGSLSETVGTVIGVAISITPPPQVLIPANFQPVSLRCIPCAPIFPGHRQWRAFG